MKRFIKLPAVLLTILLLCTSCATRPKLTYDKDGIYTGFNNIPKNYTSENAYKDGCYVIDSKAKQGYYSDKAWTKFIEDTKKNKKCSVRIVSVYDDNTYVKDLFYDGKSYIYIASDKKENVYQYKYLLKLQGTAPNAVKSGTFFYLTNDKDLTYNKVIWSMLSSNSKDHLDGKFVIMD
ncbi:hypothetical protein RBG61_12300 [Paludicola sp. MB14-C6]|uniref:hypothetical protein n=1 Tax=Paludihabitans sp. MB14-C6 TaxID=3070656 RepID=UPI0027DCECFC|nr:hypothetical protein [Paludicola sp. MB14-C6]WMJ22761.1 hypothetical protein RBG61_12300 [Paludicola sp. MB14-C6]